MRRDKNADKQVNTRNSCLRTSALKKDDKEYNDCPWARFTFDCDNGSLVIAGDAGEYSYIWGHNENEKFMHLMSRINKYYLMDKISGRYMLNLKESKSEQSSILKAADMKTTESHQKKNGSL